MRRFLPLICGLLLAGCYSDQKQQVSACDLQVMQRGITDDRASMEYIALCMRAQGYEFFDDHCPDQNYLIPKLDPDYLKSLSQEQQDRLHIERGGKMIAIDRLQRSDPACYEPMGWFGKKVLSFERYWGMAPDWRGAARGGLSPEQYIRKYIKEHPAPALPGRPAQ